MSAQEDLDLINTLLEDKKVLAGAKATYKGKQYSLAELTRLRDQLETTIGEQETAAATAAQQKRLAPKGEREKALKIAQARGVLTTAEGNLNIAISRGGDVSAAQTDLVDAINALKVLNPNDELLQPYAGVVLGGKERVVAAPRATADIRGEGTATAPQSSLFDRRRPGDTELGTKVVGATLPQVVETPTPGKGGEVPKATAADRKAFVDAELVKRKLADTPENRAMLRKEFAAQAAKTAPAVLTPELEQAFITKYPTYAWMLTDLDRTKYSDVFQLIAEASDPLKEMDAAEFKRRFEGTSFTQELALKKINRELTGSIGAFSWGSGQLAKFLNKANQYGYTGESLKQAAYQALFEQDTQTKQYKNPNAINEVKASTPFLRLKKIGNDYLAPLSDDRIIETLTGGIAEDDVLRLTREKAIALYPHLTRQIEAGLTLQDLAYDYKTTAAQLLEKTPDQIDMSDYRFNVALKTGETGKERMMSTSEWANKIRTDESYGWQYTKQANDQATELALGLARAFGKRK